MNDYSYYGERLQDHDTAPKLCPDILNARDYPTCPAGSSVTGHDTNSDAWLLVTVTCKRWNCPYCANRKIRRLAWMVKNAQPNRLLTLTHSDTEWHHAEIDTPDGPKQISKGENCWRASSAAFPELVRFARKEYGECEYLRVLELQSNGMPHFHCLLRSSFLPHARILAEWRRLCGKAGVNIKKIDQTFATFRYLVKYLTKLHKIPWTDRHLSYSKKFFNPADLEQIEYAKMDSIVKYDSHPFVFLQERYGGKSVQVLGEGKWLLPWRPDIPNREIDPQSLGLPGPPAAAEKIPLKQRIVPGLEAVERPDDDSGLQPDGTYKKKKRKCTYTT